jgi:hypothetical protein
MRKIDLKVIELHPDTGCLQTLIASNWQAAYGPAGAYNSPRAEKGGRGMMVFGFHVFRFPEMQQIL